MRFEAAWSVEALGARGAHIVPLAAGLALCPQGSIVRVIDLVVVGIVRDIVVLVLRSGF